MRPVVKVAEVVGVGGFAAGSSDRDERLGMRLCGSFG